MSGYLGYGRVNGPELEEFMEFLFVTGELDGDEDDEGEDVDDDESISGYPCSDHTQQTSDAFC